MGVAESLSAFLATATSAPWHPGRLPKDPTLPAGTYQRISTVRPATHSGGSAWAMMRYQLTVYSERYAEGLAIARLVIDGLNGTRQAMDGLDVSATLADEAEDVDPEPRGLFRQRIDVMIGAEGP